MSSVKNALSFRCFKFIQIGMLIRMRAMKETERRKLVAGTGGRRAGGENKERLVKESKLSTIRQVRSEDLMYNVVTLVDSTVLYN